MIPSCFSQPNTPSSKTSRHNNNNNTNKTKKLDSDSESESESESGDKNQNQNQNLVTCIYQACIYDSSSPTYLTLTWSKTLFSHTLTIHASDNSFSTTLSLIPPTFSLFRPKPGSKSIPITRPNKTKLKLKLYYDFTRAKFPRGSAEPESQFYLAITAQRHLHFFLGDPTRLAGAPATIISRREHVFGNGKRYWSKAVVSGQRREIGIEFCCGKEEEEEELRVIVDGETRLSVTRLGWKFRGNERISIGLGSEVEFFWDVLNWVTGDRKGHAVFVFHAGDNGVWPEFVGPEKRLIRKSLDKTFDSDPIGSYCYYNYSNNNNNNYNCGSSSSSSVLQWAEESSDCGSRSSCSSSRSRSSVGNNNNGGFSLLLYAWRKD